MSALVLSHLSHLPVAPEAAIQFQLFRASNLPGTPFHFVLSFFNDVVQSIICEVYVTYFFVSSAQAKFL